MNQNNLVWTVLLITVLSACSKENDPSVQPNVDAFAANEALIDSNAGTYFVCDVEGIDSVQKIILQSTRNTCDFGWGTGWCSTGYYEFSSKVKNLKKEIGTDIILELSFRGKCPVCEMDDLVKPGIQQLQHLGQKYIGAAVWLSYPNPVINNISTGPFYSSNAVSADMQVDDSIEIVSLVARSSGNPAYNIKIRFNCTLQSSYGPTIKLKNAIYSSKI